MRETEERERDTETETELGGLKAQHKKSSSWFCQGLAARVDADADICYCEAKHVQLATQLAACIQLQGDHINFKLFAVSHGREVKPFARRRL